MIKVAFKNLKKSDLIRRIAIERIQKTLKKFPEFDNLNSYVIVSKEHSLEHSGMNEYSVKFLLNQKGHKSMVLEKRAMTLYKALALVTDRALELLHRANEKVRLENRHKIRKWKSTHKWDGDFLKMKKGA